ncbi:protein EXORDIUM-like 6 [Gastrolobium bilobum]|uniref:protein EXORDIUM-like 6 n=1 Tax=Gastrolobium bilobum TaxID=150636 RepID=UPI002AAF4631|nr:protein EXORDIUM-like 6 [Gastrolobium bilobum]
MASFIHNRLLCFVLSLLIILPLALSSVPEETSPLVHHGGRLLTGNLNIGILWYGPIPKAQKKAILSFLRSLNIDDAAAADKKPQVSTWWHIVESYQAFAKTPTPGTPRIQVKVVHEEVDPNYSYGKVLIKDFIKPLIPKATAGRSNTLALIVASNGVTVQDMCAGSCAQHGLIEEQPYVAVGDPEEECPECAWPFLPSPTKPTGIMKPPSGNVGADSMVMLLAGGLAGAVTNPYMDGFYSVARGEHIIEVTTKCSGIFATGKLPVNPVNGGVFNTHGEEDTKFLLPALWNPKTSSCWTPL